MKSRKTLELIKWLNDSTNIIDQPRDFTPFETKRIVDIAESEYIGIDVSDKIADFKKNWYKDCDVKSTWVKESISKLEERLNPRYDLLLSESEVIQMVELAEFELHKKEEI